MLAWLVSAPSSYRREESEILPFTNALRHRHRASREASQQCVKQVFQQHGVAEWKPCQLPYIMGVAKLAPKSVFHWGIVLSEDEYPQYLYYKAHGCNPLDMWMLSVEDAVPISGQVRADYYCSKHLRFSIDFVGEQDSRDLVRFLHRMPPWLQGCEGSVQLCLVFPGAFAKLIANAVWRQLLVPSPFSAQSNGPFGGMSRQFLSQECFAELRQMKATLGLPRDDVGEVGAFDFTRCLPCAAALQTVSDHPPAQGRQVLLQCRRP